MNSRRLARETVLQALYAYQLSGYDAQYITDTNIKTVLGNDKVSQRFAEKLFFTTLANGEEFDEVIIKHIQNWEIGRLALIDRLILRMALCEFVFFEEIPLKVTINEAIEIAKKFSTAKSGRFVNGILDASADELTEQGRIVKKGRGLIQETIKKNSVQ